MMKTVKKIVMVVLLLIGVLSCFLVSNSKNDIKMIPLFIGNNKFTVELADTSEKWMMGLMYRENITDNFGMLFVSDSEDYHSFWMKNCKIHLDIIFLDSYKQVINIHTNVPPCTVEPCATYPSLRPAQYVLELRGNRAKELNLKPGDTISFTY